MTVKEAVKTAIDYTQDLFSEQAVSSLRLEEVEFDNEKKEWAITIGFLRAREFKTSSAINIAAAALFENSVERIFKVVKINEDTQNITSVKDRQ
jgi:hypothetical protein